MKSNKIKDKEKIIDVALSTIFVIVFMISVNTIIGRVDINNEAIEVIGENRLRPIYEVDTDKKEIALTFNAVWGGDNVYEILDVLDKYNVKATFFVTGYWANDYKDELIEIKRRGHEIGNHSDNHTHATKLTYEQNVEEIVGVHKKIKETLGIDMNLYRPPFGEYNNTVMMAVNDMNYYPIQWSIDSNDWMEKGVDFEVQSVLKNSNLKDGAILLFHIGSQYTPQSLDKILNVLINEEGYKVTTVGELIYKDEYYINNKGTQIKK